MCAALICGVDFSSKALHACLLPLDEDHGDASCPPVTLRVVELPSWRAASTTPQFRSVERCRVIRSAMRELLAPAWTSPTAWLKTDQHDVAHVCVEEPFGASRKADNVLRELYGAILASIPPHINRDTIGTREWRTLAFSMPPGASYDPGPFTWKSMAIAVAHGATGIDMNEHHAEAYLIATAARQRLATALQETT